MQTTTTTNKQQKIDSILRKFNKRKGPTPKPKTKAQPRVQPNLQPKPKPKSAVAPKPTVRRNKREREPEEPKEPKNPQIVDSESIRRVGVHTLEKFNRLFGFDLKPNK